MKYSLALNLSRVQTRSNNRFITCPVVEDRLLKREREAEIDKLDKDLKGIFKHQGELSNIEIGPDGRLIQKGGDTPVMAYGPRRNRFFATQSQLNLLKAIPCPGSESGLIIRFNLLHPVAMLLEGINRKREITLNEIRVALKCIDILGGDTRKTEEERRKFFDVVDAVFADEAAPGVKEDSRSLIREIDRLKSEDPTGETAWRFLTDRLLEGKGKNILQAISLRLLGDGMDLLFCVWPLITGNEISIDVSREDEIHRFQESLPETLVVCSASDEIRSAPEDDDPDNNDNADEKNGDNEKSTDETPPAEKTSPKKEFEDRTVREKPSPAIPVKKNQLPLLDYLKRELEDLLKNVFSKYLDISAATVSFRSEPILAGMIIQHCLNIKSDTNTFKDKLTKQLQHHYKIHIEFLEEYLADKEGVKSIFQKIHKLKADIENQITDDADGIMELIQNARDRLYSPGENSRLLCLIDPYSVDVQIGNFTYDGDSLTDEEKFITNNLKLQNELAEMKKKQDYEAQKGAEIGKIEGKKREGKYLGELKGLDKKKEKAIKEAEINEAISKKESEVETRINEAKIEKVISEIKLSAIDSLKSGNIKDYAIYTLTVALQEKGIDEVQRLFKESPDLFMAISPELHQKKHAHDLKKQLLKIIEKDSSKLDPLTVAMLFGEDLKNIVDANIYKDFTQMLSNALQGARTDQLPTIFHKISSSLPVQKISDSPQKSVAPDAVSDSRPEANSRTGEGDGQSGEEETTP